MRRRVIIAALLLCIGILGARRFLAWYYDGDLQDSYEYTYTDTYSGE